MGLRHARDIRSQAPPLFSRVCVEKIGEPGDEAREYTSYLGCCHKNLWGGGGDRDQSNRSLSACPPLLSNVLILDVIATYMYM